MICPQRLGQQKRRREVGGDTVKGMGGAKGARAMGSGSGEAVQTPGEEGKGLGATTWGRAGSERRGCRRGKGRSGRRGRLEGEAAGASRQERAGRLGAAEKVGVVGSSRME